MGNVVDDLEALRKRVDEIEERRWLDATSATERADRQAAQIESLFDRMAELIGVPRRVDALDAFKSDEYRLHGDLEKRLASLESRTRYTEANIVDLEYETQNPIDERLTALESAVARLEPREPIPKPEPPPNIMVREGTSGREVEAKPGWTVSPEPFSVLATRADVERVLAEMDKRDARLHSRFNANVSDAAAMEQHIAARVDNVATEMRSAEARLATRVNAWGALLEYLATYGARRFSPAKEKHDALLQRAEAALRALGRDGGGE